MTFEDESHKLPFSETSGDPQSTHILLPEIVIEILARLPVESLLWCKSVCKLWHSLISDNHFVKYHLSLSNSNSEYAHHRLIMCTKTSVKWCPLHNVIHDKSINTIELNYPLKHPQKIVLIVGSCNGLLCIHVVEDNYGAGGTIFIWNPSTRRSNKLPYSGFYASGFQVYGFGYDEFSDDYKVVLIARNKYATMVMIYSLKSGNWKRIDGFSHCIPLDFSGKFSNGALHWPVTTDLSSSSSWKIISLDLATETYSEVLQPIYDDGDMHLQLGVLGEWLCVVCNYSENRKIDVWVMKAYGVKDSWTKLVSIQNLTDPPTSRLRGILNVGNDDQILLQYDETLVLYNVKNDSFSEIKDYDGVLVAWMTVESLVSPDALKIADR